MKTLKKGLAIALALSFTLVAVTAATPTAAYADADAAAAASPSYVSNQLKGTAVVKEPLSDGQLLVTVNDMEVELNISDETLVIDSKTSLPASLEDLKVNDTIFVCYSAAMTRSLPPQSHAIAIVTQVEKDKSHAELFTVREIISRNDSEVRALNKEGDLIVSFSKETALSPYKTKQIVTNADIQVGTQLFIWYDIVAMSYPGQTGATKAVLVGQEEGMGVRAVYTPMSGVDAVKVTIQGKDVQLGGKNPADMNGLLMLPLRSVAEGLGFKVTWNAADKSILLDDGAVKTTIYIGEDSYFKASSKAIGLTQSFSLGAAPTLVGNSTYVPAAIFNLLYRDNDAVKIETKQ
ncbi:MAG: copper amine oxidase N-terminal domain-containing protein [Clostridiales bacterium]|nr:copper amine oxidase N-terminal domain-containing protein [Clostridiales bacterium]